jgi:hypothetical protein
VTQSEYAKHRTAHETAELQVERVKTLYELFKSIKDSPPAAANPFGGR